MKTQTHVITLTCTDSQGLTDNTDFFVTMLAVACALLDRQIKTLAEVFGNDGGGPKGYIWFAKRIAIR